MERSVRIALRLMAVLGQVAAPALAAQMALVQSAQGQTALPPPPYASAMPQSTGYGGPQTYDRYGGGTMHARVAAPGATAASTYAGPRLGWSGKTETAQPQRPQPLARYAQPTQPPAPQGWTYVNPIGQRPPEPSPPPAPPAQPASIYDPSPPIRQAASATPAPGGPRHYSLHSEFGIQPDPIPPPGQAFASGAVAAGPVAEPLPAAFFGQSPDFAASETADPARKVTSGSGKSRNAVQPEGGR